MYFVYNAIILYSFNLKSTQNINKFNNNLINNYFNYIIKLILKNNPLYCFLLKISF
jgi:hypothetical protein